jgi:hypothetical protein
LLHLVGPDARPNSQLYSAAQSRDQAAILFRLAAKVVRMSPELADVVTVRDTAKQPETFQAQCDAELALGRRAAERLKELLDFGDVRVIESGKIDRYGRTLAHLTVHDRDVGGVLIGEGLARAYSGGRRQSQCE